MHRPILALDRMTNPAKWLSVQSAVKYHATDKVIQDVGEPFVIVCGGHRGRPVDGRMSGACSNSMIDGADQSARHHGLIQKKFQTEFTGGNTGHSVARYDRAALANKGVPFACTRPIDQNVREKGIGK